MGRFRNAWRALTKPAPAGVVVKGRRNFDGAASGRLSGWNRSAADINTDITKSLDTLRKSCRDLDKNNPWMRRIVDAWVNAAIADGLRPTVVLYTGRTVDGKPERDKAAEARVYDLWERWGRAPVSGSRMSVYGMQRAMFRALILDGEPLARYRPRFPADMPGLPPFKVQLLEADLLPVTKTESVGNGLNRIINGIEVDALGEVVAFHLYKEHPGASVPWGTTWETVRIPAREMIHAFRALRPGQMRGVPEAAPVITALWDLHGYQDNIRVNARAVATMVATVDGGDPDDNPAGLNPQRDESGAIVKTNDTAFYGDGSPVESLEGGTVIYSPDGRKVTIHNPGAPTGVKEFVSDSLHEIAAGVGLSYNVLSGDMGDSSFAQAKLGLIEQAKNVSAMRRTVFVPMVLDPLWRTFIDFAVTAGLLPNRADLYNVRWSDPRQQSADRKTEVEAAILEVRAGFRTQDDVVESDYGMDPDETRERRAAEVAANKAVGIVVDSDPSQVTLQGQAQVAPSAPTKDAKDETTPPV